MTTVEGSDIFVSYRRLDTGHLAGRLCDDLKDNFGLGRVFVDVSEVKPGSVFPQQILRAVAACRVFLVIIGAGWLTAVDGQRRRLHDPEDLHRREIEAALDRDVHIIPVLADGARMPTPQDLPETLHGLSSRQWLSIRQETYHDDIRRLTMAVEDVLAAVEASGSSNVHGTVAEHASGEMPPKALATPRSDAAWVAGLLSDAWRIANSITDKRAKSSALAAVAKPLIISNPARAARLLNDAEHIASGITEQYSKVSVLTDLANNVAAADPGRAARVLDDAERIADAITSSGLREQALFDVALALAGTKPSHAEDIAASITNQDLKVLVLTSVASAVAVADPGRAARLLDDAEDIARAVTGDDRQVSALVRVARAWGAINPGRASWLLVDAEHTASSFANQSALAKVAEARSAIDPRRAERTANAITDADWKITGLTAVARAVTDTDPGWAARLLADAERIADSITNQYSKNLGLAEVAEALATIDPTHAERMASAITYLDSKIEVLAAVARSVAAADPNRAARLLADAEHAADAIADKPTKSLALGQIVEALTALRLIHRHEMFRNSYLRNGAPV